MKLEPRTFFARIVSLIVLSLFFVMIIIAFTVGNYPASIIGYILMSLNILLYIYMFIVAIYNLVITVKKETTQNDHTIWTVNLILSIVGFVLFSIIYGGVLINMAN